MLMSDKQIREIGEEHIRPYEPALVSKVDGRPVISYGTSSYGYDIRMGSTSVVYAAEGSHVDPKGARRRVAPDGVQCTGIEHSEQCTVVRGCDPFIIRPGEFLLTHSFEYIKVPRNYLVVCLGKSTYARCGIILNVTPLEPEWEGQITLEVSNTNTRPVVLYPGEGIGQLLFVRGESECVVSYADRKGKYQCQTGVTLPFV